MFIVQVLLATPVILHEQLFRKQGMSIGLGCWLSLHQLVGFLRNGLSLGRLLDRRGCRYHTFVAFKLTSSQSTAIYPSVVEAGGSSLWPDSGLRLRCVPSTGLIYLWA